MASYSDSPQESVSLRASSLVTWAKLHHFAPTVSLGRGVRTLVCRRADSLRQMPSRLCRSGVGPAGESAVRAANYNKLASISVHDAHVIS